MSKDSDPSLPDGERLSADLDRRLRDGNLSRRTEEDDCYEILDSPELLRETLYDWCQDFLDKFFLSDDLRGDAEAAGLLLGELARIKGELPEPIISRAMAERATIQDMFESFGTVLARSDSLVRANEAGSTFFVIGTNAAYDLRRKKRIVQLAVELDKQVKG